MTGRSERIAEEFEVKIRWIAFPLHPETPPEGRSLADLFHGRDIDIDAVLDRLQRVAAELGLPFGNRPMTYNSRLAQELGKWAEAQDRGHDFHLAAFKVYFADGRNIHQTEVLAEIAESVGLDPAAAASVLADRRYRKAVDADWAQARDAGIHVVPTFSLNGDLLEGAVPYESLVKLMERNGVARRKGAP